MTDYVVITGASSGIGRAVTIRLANLGYNVIAIGSNEIELKRTQVMTGAVWKNVTTIVADLSELDNLDKIVSHFKPGDRVRYLIHSAATTKPHAPLTAVSLSEFEKSMNINVKAPVFLTQRLRSYFDIRLTRVLFMGSDYVGMNGKSRPHITDSYAIAKSALDSAVKYLRHVESTASIGYLNPGSTNTPMLKAVKESVLKRDGFFPSTQLADPGDVAKFITAILEDISVQDYSNINWDYRDKQHQLLVQKSIMPTVLHRSAL